MLPNLPEYFTGIAPKAVVWETARKWLHSLGIKYQRMHSLGIKYQRINGKTGFADGHERLDVKAQRRHFVNIMSELGKESFLYFSPITVERAAMWGIPQKVIEERIMEIREGEGAKVQLHVDDIPQGSAMEVLREGIEHGGVQYQLPLGMERKKLWIFYQDESIFKAYDGARMRWMPPDFIGRLLKKGEGPGIMITAFVNESIGWLKLSSQDMAAINAKRTIEEILPCKYFIAHKGCYYGFHAFQYGKAREGYWDGDKMLEQVIEFVDAFNFLHPEDQALFIFDCPSPWWTSFL